MRIEIERIQESNERLLARMKELVDECPGCGRCTLHVEVAELRAELDEIRQWLDLRRLDICERSRAV